MRILIKPLLIILCITISSLASVTCKKTDSASDGVTETITVTDGWKRTLDVPKNPRNIICSGPGCLRYLTYLEAQDRVVAVDDMEKKRTRFDARPYALANPKFKKLRIFGEFRGHDNPELIVTLKPQPQVIFKTFGEMGHDPLELQNKTGIPVVVLNYGDIINRRDSMYQSLRIMGKVLGKEKRAEEVISYFEDAIKDLKKRTAGIPESKMKSCYIGGVAYKGPHGFQSTEPNYPPFAFNNARNVSNAALIGNKMNQANVAKENIIKWDPEIIFVDLSTMQSESKASALYELKRDPAYRQLSACIKGNIYGVLPYNWYTINYGSILANAYFIGTILYPAQFKDIDPVKKADEIYTFLVGKPVYEKMNKAFKGKPFTKLSL